MAVKINGVELERLGVTSNRENQTRTAQTFAGIPAVWPSIKYAYNAEGKCVGRMTATGNVVPTADSAPVWPGDEAVPIQDSCWCRGY